MDCERLHWELPGYWELCPRPGHHNPSHPLHLDRLDPALCNGGMDSTGPALSLRPRPQPGGPRRAGLALLAPVSRAALGDSGRNQEAPALRMWGLQGRGSQERPAR